jgi:hypothetical protein
LPAIFAVTALFFFAVKLGVEKPTVPRSTMMPPGTTVFVAVTVAVVDPSWRKIQIQISHG